MRGLTREEREALIEASTPSDLDNGSEANDQERAVYERLCALGRARVVSGTTDEWYFEDWRTTDLGQLALRVCPVGEE